MYLVAMPPRMIFVTRSVKTDLTNLHNLYSIIIANVEDTQLSLWLSYTHKVYNLENSYCNDANFVPL